MLMQVTILAKRAKSLLLLVAKLWSFDMSSDFSRMKFPAPRYVANWKKKISLASYIEAMNETKWSNDAFLIAFLRRLGCPEGSSHYVTKVSSAPLSVLPKWTRFSDAVKNDCLPPQQYSFQYRSWKNGYANSSGKEINRHKYLTVSITPHPNIVHFCMRFENCLRF